MEGMIRRPTRESQRAGFWGSYWVKRVRGLETRNLVTVNNLTSNPATDPQLEVIMAVSLGMAGILNNKCTANLHARNKVSVLEARPRYESDAYERTLSASHSHSN